MEQQLKKAEQDCERLRNENTQLRAQLSAANAENNVLPMYVRPSTGESSSSGQVAKREGA